MRYLSALSPVLVVASFFLASIGQAAPLQSLPAVVSSVSLPELPAPFETVQLEGNEFSQVQLVLPAVSQGRGPVNPPNKPRFQVPEPNGLFLLSLGVFSMGLLRLRTKNQTA
ncbi:MAG TPA: PEP-CTERM sorting domain-containing protein [Cellvibrionaceae bacterium]